MVSVRRMRAIVMWGFLLLGFGGTELAQSQSMYLDANGDGLCTANDSINTAGTTTLRVWLVTDRDRAGVLSSLSDQYKDSLTVNSYEVVLHCTGGKVAWGQFTNNQPTMDVPFGTKYDDTEYYVAYAGACRQPPGKYMLGTIQCRVSGTNPSITIVPKSHLGPTCQTSFGSRCLGKNGSNTLVLGDAESVKLPQPGTGDWSDVQGVLADTDPARAAALKTQTAEARVFFIRRVGGPAAASLRLVISTTRRGPVHADVFDVTGRRVVRLIDEPDAMPTIRSVPLAPQGKRLANGVYFYKVVTGEGHQEGKFVLLR